MIAETLGRYEILCELGQGAMGVVYKAIDPLIERAVAIKTIHLDLSRDELELFETRFFREAKSAGRLNHPNVVTIYDVGKTDRIAYITMELLEGRSLRQLLDRENTLPAETAASLAAQVAEGLSYAHASGIVHRDIKPANIVVVREDLVKITDFGIALVPAGTRTLAGKVLGSPRYMSPEQVIGQSIDGRSDIFSLGVVLYEMLTGRSPFTGDNISTIMYRILNETPPAPSMVSPGVPAAFDAIIQKTLAKDPSARYQDAKELAHDLRHYAELPLSRGFGLVETRPAVPAAHSAPKLNIGDATLWLSQVSGAAAPERTSSGHTLEATAGAPRASRLRWLPGTLIAAMLVAGLTAVGQLWLDHRPLAVPVPNRQALVVPRMASPVPKSQPTPAPVAPGQAAQAPLAPPTEKAIPQTPAHFPIPYRRDVRRPSRIAREQPADHQASSPAAAAPGTGAAGTLSFAITPWGEVYIDGKTAGVSPPLTTLKVPAGPHRIEIRNLNFKPYAQTMNIKAGDSYEVKYLFK
ncbi:MAG: protein kinase [Betaproteobacteria bacterium]|nr:protein kinase [Betaproteobacteria bacterium]